ncbi:hypothetical protein QBA54_39640 [Streptomyces sp. B21-108]|jgi:hypothetical protein|uniref:hypothetical protein n=1 Tax=Streptomyces sp. B21-108 TaxID=3039419 RepID=UPI002FEED831
MTDTEGSHGDVLATTTPCGTSPATFSPSALPSLERTSAPVVPAGPALVETAPGVTVEEIRARTGAPLHTDAVTAAC